MIVNHEKRFGFIHIPRTGGTSIKSAIKQIAPDSIMETKNVFQHAPLWAILERLPDTSDYTWYSGIRYPWEIMESEYRLSMVIAKKDAAKTPEHKEYLEFITKDGFPEYVERQYFGTKRPLIRGGFWKSFCCIDGQEVGVKPIRLTHFQEDFDLFCEAHELPKVEIKKQNEINWPRPNWPAALLDKVVRFCYYDMLESFH